MDSVNVFLQAMISRMGANIISYSRGCISKRVKDASDSLTIQNSSFSVWKGHKSSLAVSHPAAHEKENHCREFLVVQGLGLQTLTAVGLGLIAGLN